MSKTSQGVAEKRDAARPQKASLRVWKFDVERPKVGDDGKPQSDYGFALRMPKGAQIFSVARQHQTARIFAFVNPNVAEEERYFWAAETNHDLPGPEDLNAEFARTERQVQVAGLVPLGTWFEMNESVSKHVFEIVTEPILGEKGEKE